MELLVVGKLEWVFSRVLLADFIWRSVKLIHYLCSGHWESVNVPQEQGEYDCVIISVSCWLLVIRLYELESRDLKANESTYTYRTKHGRSEMGMVENIKYLQFVLLLLS
jgi:hypothetical protein